MSVHLARNSMQKNVAVALDRHHQMRGERGFGRAHRPDMQVVDRIDTLDRGQMALDRLGVDPRRDRPQRHGDGFAKQAPCRSEEHTSELQSLMRISYAVFCLKKTTLHIPT